MQQQLNVKLTNKKRVDWGTVGIVGGSWAGFMLLMYATLGAGAFIFGALVAVFIMGYELNARYGVSA